MFIIYYNLDFDVKFIKAHHFQLNSQTFNNNFISNKFNTEFDIITHSENDFFYWIKDWINLCNPTGLHKVNKKDIYVDFEKGKNGIILNGCIIKNFTIKESNELEISIIADHHEIIDDNFIKKYKRDSKINELFS